MCHRVYHRHNHQSPTHRLCSTPVPSLCPDHPVISVLCSALLQSRLSIQTTQSFLCSALLYSSPVSLSRPPSHFSSLLYSSPVAPLSDSEPLDLVVGVETTLLLITTSGQSVLTSSVIIIIIIIIHRQIVTRRNIQLPVLVLVSVICLFRVCITLSTSYRVN